jgi:Protein ChrB, N-terminal
MPTEWVLLSYRLPREPSTPRIATWRKMKRLGVAQINDGLVALPDNARTREQLEWLAAEILEAGGSAVTWLARPAIIQAGRDLIAELTAARVAEYQAIIQEAKEAAEMSESARRAAKRRLQAELNRVAKRDYFPTPERNRAHETVAAIVDS